jgi:hypothetical protein
MIRINRKKSVKAHIEDPAKNENFKRETTPALKIKRHKLARGTFRGKRWFPQ